MRSTLASLTAGVLAVGAVPTTLALADDDAADRTAGREDAGPPPWAPAHGFHKTNGVEKHTDKDRAHAEKRKQQAEWSDADQGPPPWAKAYGKRGGHGHADGREHAKAMRAWERCVAKADPRAECTNPTPPGLSR